MAAGADLGRVLRLQVEHHDLGRCELSLPDDMDDLRVTIVKHDVALVALDPLISRLSGRLDSHKDAEVRLALEPLARLADDTHVALIGLIHVSKSMTKDPLTAVMGSRAFVAVARSVLFAAVDPQDRTKRVLSLVKSNVGRDDSAGLPSLAYRIDGATVDTPEGPASTSCVVWTGVAERGAREIMADSGGEPSSAREDAEGFLLDLLAGGPVESAKVRSEARAAGLSWATLRRAKADLKVRATKFGGQFGGDPGWFWEKPAETALAEGAHEPLKGLTKKDEPLQANVSPFRRPTPVEPVEVPDRTITTKADWRAVELESAARHERVAADLIVQVEGASPEEAERLFAQADQHRAWAEDARVSAGVLPKAPDPGLVDEYLYMGKIYRQGDILPDGRIVTFEDGCRILVRRQPAQEATR